MTDQTFGKRIAILGSGFGTRVTAPALRAEGWEIRALFSRRLERAEQNATKLEIPHHTDDYLALVTSDAHLDAPRERAGRPGGWQARALREAVRHEPVAGARDGAGRRSLEPDDDVQL